MRKVIGVIIICSSIILLMGGEEMVAYGQETRPPGSDEVLIGPNAIIIPLGRILLVRKDLDYCGIKFTRFWTGKTLDDQYAAYESYYQGDKTGDFSNSKVELRDNILYFPKPGFSIFGHPIHLGEKLEIICGPIMLLWSGKGSVHFFKKSQPQGDYGIELGPTRWTDISRVNVFDPRIKWYRYDSKRKDIIISIDQLCPGD